MHVHILKKINTKAFPPIHITIYWVLTLVLVLRLFIDIVYITKHFECIKRFFMISNHFDIA